VWETAEAMGTAKKTVKARHQEIGFNSSEMFAKLGIKADITPKWHSYSEK
jgi:hypothetical protein